MTDDLLQPIFPEWPAPARVHSLVTTRVGGVSRGPYASLNLGEHVGDDPRCVAENRRRLRRWLPAEPHWLRQVHGTTVALLDRAAAPSAAPGMKAGDEPQVADAAVTRTAGVVCAVQVADCLPVLLCDRDGTVVGVAHAGWRGLAAGVIERTVAAMGTDPARLMAWLGPAIGPDSFEVGDDVREAFLRHEARAAFAFLPRDNGKWLANLYLLARQRLEACGVRAVYAEQACTFSEPQRFYSYRRDRITGRMAALVWLA
ncbi:peptidoglycan editing factor PgeF [Pelomicrobium methylotrophicum]|uniref:Purine nucleoside phosphorylase n=1 Tax=Pelomicrobium methylotrophicum TaxID=2602750 RepID=A0A5C7EXC7_9PROT|nr:peptidoglycan editing factor PgeF [Pelomicrobium methylotrophicum]TXF11719.1 peptidoglycan editing factor PgeF [Pelomicrobium methylotrophicum]